MVQGDIGLYEPGDKPDVLVVANADGSVAQRGDMVEVVGETPDYTTVRKTTADGRGVGVLIETPFGYDEAETYAGGAEVGDATIALGHRVDYLKVAGAGWDQTDVTPAATSAAVGDFVMSAENGTVQMSDPAVGEAMGVVWATNNRREAHRNGKVAVVRWR